MMTIICCERREENLLTAVSKLMDGWMDGRMQIGREREGCGQTFLPPSLHSSLTVGLGELNE